MYVDPVFQAFDPYIIGEGKRLILVLSKEQKCGNSLQKGHFNSLQK